MSLPCRTFLDTLYKGIVEVSDGTIRRLKLSSAAIHAGAVRIRWPELEEKEAFQ